MKLIGRIPEQAIFAKAMSSSKSEMVAVIGRRRVGKTFLIRKYFERKMTFEFTGIYAGTQADHARQFAKSYAKYFGNKKNIEPKNWFDMFDLLEQGIERLKKKGKFVIFLDELPWMGGSNSMFIKALSTFWNSWASKREDIVLILSGSSTSWMVKKIFDNKGGLHNRTTQRIDLKPFTLQETALFLKYKKCNLAPQAIAEIYMTIGGIPYYLEFIEPHESVAQIIDKLFFRKTASLKSEFTELFHSLFDNSELYITLVTLLAKRHYGLTRNQLLQTIKIDSGGNFTRALTDLEKSGFITAYIPFGKKSKDKKFKLTDLFTLFYLKFIGHDNSKVQWKKLINTPAYRSWCGFAFENLCMNHTLQIERALKIDGINTQVSSWYHAGNATMHGAQIDLLIERDDKIINVCELKYHDHPLVLTKAFVDSMRSKIAAFSHFTGTTKTIFTTIISPFGVHQNKYTTDYFQSIVVLDDLFKQL